MHIRRPQKSKNHKNIKKDVVLEFYILWARKCKEIIRIYKQFMLPRIQFLLLDALGHNVEALFLGNESLTYRISQSLVRVLLAGSRPVWFEKRFDGTMSSIDVILDGSTDNMARLRVGYSRGARTREVKNIIRSEKTREVQGRVKTKVRWNRWYTRNAAMKYHGMYWLIERFKQRISKTFLLRKFQR